MDAINKMLDVAERSMKQVTEHEKVLFREAKTALIHTSRVGVTHFGWTQEHMIAEMMDIALHMGFSLGLERAS